MTQVSLEKRVEQARQIIKHLNDSNKTMTLLLEEAIDLMTLLPYEDMPKTRAFVVKAIKALR